jgi:DNA-binding CsgD family transcriptional regulator
VLRLLVAERSYREFAKELDLSKNTVAAIAQRSKLAG